MVNDIFLNPGDYYFGDSHTRLRTLLGSCVSFIVWHPQLKIGGMCHYLLPSRQDNGCGQIDGRYAEEAVRLLLRDVFEANTVPAEYQVWLAGGGNMFYCPTLRDNGNGNIPSLNIEAGRRLVEHYGFSLEAEDMGGFGYRNVLFDVGSGQVQVQVKHNSAAFPASEGAGS